MAQNTSAPTVVGLFRNPEDADQAIQRLRSQGLDNAQVSVMTREPVIPPPTRDYILKKDEVAFGRITGATAGATVGIFAGVLLGLTALSVPGVGPALSLSTFATILGSAILGSIVGAIAGGLLLSRLAKVGLSEEQVNFSAKRATRGELLVAIQTDEAHVKQVEESLREANAADMNVLQETVEPNGNYSRF